MELARFKTNATCSKTEKEWLSYVAIPYWRKDKSRRKKMKKKHEQNIGLPSNS